MSSADYREFVASLAEEGLTNLQKAIALIWYKDHYSDNGELSGDEIADRLEQTGLTGQVNRTRLRGRLQKSPEVVRGQGRDAFRIPLSGRAQLDEKYLPLLERPRPTVSDRLLPRELVDGTRPYLEKMAFQANGCYDYGFYDACAVMCRRMVESLLIEAFHSAGHIGAITDGNGHLYGLEDIIGMANSGQYIKLPRGTGRTLDSIKSIGDTAAHDRYHIATKHDIHEFRAEFRKTISQLLAISGIGQ